jgi:hypothetical protein
MVMRFLIVIFSFFSCVTYAQTVYQSTDAQGNVIFSDKPNPQAIRKQLNELPSFPSNQPITNPSQSSPAEKTAMTAMSYETLMIDSPKNEETIWSNQGIVLVKVNVQPSLANNDKMIVAIDGVDKAEITSGNSVTLKDIERGSHQLSVKMINPAGDVVKTSPSVTFYLHKANLNTNPMPPPVIQSR